MRKTGEIQAPPSPHPGQRGQVGGQGGPQVPHEGLYSLLYSRTCTQQLPEMPGPLRIQASFLFGLSGGSDFKEHTNKDERAGGPARLEGERLHGAPQPGHDRAGAGHCHH